MYRCYWRFTEAVSRLNRILFCFFFFLLVSVELRYPWPLNSQCLFHKEMFVRLHYLTSCESKKLHETTWWTQHFNYCTVQRGLLFCLPSWVAVEQWVMDGRLPFLVHPIFDWTHVADGEGGAWMRWLFVQAHSRTLVHAHVGITQESTRLALDALRVQRMELLRTHF